MVIAPDIPAARAFLKRLDAEADTFTLQTFDDSAAKRREAAAIHEIDPANGELDKLAGWNKRGAGLFVTVNRTDGNGRQTHNVTHVRAVFVDLDGAPIAPVLEAKPEPHIVVQSSRGRFHAYWLCDDCALEDFSNVQRALAARFGGDPSVHDLPRVMRMPGFVHCKNGEYLSHVLPDVGHSQPPYALAEIVGGLKLNLQQARERVVLEPGDKIQPGQRHTHLFASGRSMAKRGLSPEAVLAALAAENLARCDPPLPDADIADLAKRAFTAKDAQDWEPAAPKPDADADRETHHNNRGADEQEPSEIPRAATALELMERDMPPIAYLCDPWIPEGLNIVAGRPKLGKSTLIRQKLAAMAGGGTLLQSPCTQATSLFLSLEEGDRLTRKKFEMAGFDDAALASILIYFTWRRGKEGALDLMRVLDDNPAIRYIAIDSLTRFRTVPNPKLPPFIADYEAVTELHSIAKARPGVAIDVIHHTRKAKSDDPIEDISGTFGVSAACDSYWVMRHHEDGAVLHVGGRLWEQDASQFQLSRGKQRWELVGEFTGATSKQNETVDALRAEGGMTPTQVAKTFGIEPPTAHQRLASLVERGLVYSVGGRYFAK